MHIILIPISSAFLVLFTILGISLSFSFILAYVFFLSKETLIEILLYVTVDVCVCWIICKVVKNTPQCLFANLSDSNVQINSYEMSIWKAKFCINQSSTDYIF